MQPGAPLEVRYCAECGRPSAPEELARFVDILICPDCKNRYVQKLREGVAPAAAAAQSYAGFWVRFVAVLLDGIILMVAGSVVWALVFGFGKVPFTQIQPDATPEEVWAAMRGMFAALGVASLANMAIACIYEAAFIHLLGATPGKMALGLKVVRPGGGPIDLGRAIGRHFAKMLSGLILYIGYIMAGFDSQKRALHDMICDTRVVKANV